MQPVIPHEGHEPGVIERLLTFAIPEPNSGCWLFSGGTAGAGYGRFSCAAASNYAHRAAWLAFKGPIPAGLMVLHRCDTPCCVNPDHLFLGTSQDNLRDMIGKGRAGFQRYPAAYRKMGAKVGSTQVGRRHSSALLDEEDVRVIRFLLRRGALHVDVARCFNVSSRTIASIASGRSWRSVQ